jgi:drug/metabolite transporter (DMT)-like permease
MLVISLTAAGHYFATPHHVDLTRLPHPVYAIGLLMAVVATVLPSFLLSAGIQRVGSNRAAMLGMVGPVSTILLAYLFLGEGVTVMELVGTVLVMAGVLAITVRPASGG